MTWRVWTQYLPTTTRRDLRPGLEARLHDPLWLLARQYQIGEFFGEDAGSPVRVEVASEAFPADRIELGDTPVAYDPAAAALEAIVERESNEQVRPDLRTRAQWGLLFLAGLEEAGLPFDRAHLAGMFGFAPPDRAATSGLDTAARLLTARALDAASVYAHFRGDAVTDAELAAVFPTAPGTALDSYRATVERWLRDYEERTGQPGQGEAWLEERLEYAFRLSVPTDIGRVVLEAPEYHGGRLDWDAFDIKAVQVTDLASTPVRDRRRLVPTQLTYQGMPVPRFWEFEDAAVDFGDPGGGKRDLGRLLLAEVAMAWGNDWFQIPVEAPAGSLVRINDLLVTDTFGVTTRILAQRLHSPNWAMNRLRRTGGSIAADAFLWLAPALPVCHESAPVEEVLFLRDEMANMAWAIETTVPDPLGRPRSLRDEPEERLRGVGRLRPNVRLTYRVVPDLPDHWLPLVPVRDTAAQALFLVRAGLFDGDAAEPSLPQGVLLGLPGTFRVHEEEVGRDGAAVTRAWQVARWYDGQRTVWIGRRKRAGTGELRSRLEFDTLIPASA